ncbi:alpha/beta hydrolase [Halomonas daqingensis]|uniref:Alpha/beta hydrolase n=1 Tax=Billgrantia desiderata TaxID=52021 RepID=A0ABS9B2G0_9GAMM|nr:alpha/beta hydrolase [Halomonas desiderata]MCE8013571.1 alpha/beta hydrolase [Halomonas desiderata]MCE8030741.1 alpha/beta hydrolase [Halomonas desiderata]MCE8041281.1 alpha/beta hydrolase [Halomonas desiderata]MCE8045856.1 alpha/beta hydrolase [Halomonas desiderata]OUE37899.1 alpha/beta hydrolase [Halomonas desiderata SP1]
MSEAQPLTLAGGRLAALAWGEPSAPTWLALHGWLDNAASFSRLAPLLCTRLGVRIVALDFSGHGHSLHGAGDYALWDYCHDLLDAADELDLERVSVLAHSMGAGVACLTAAALPERIERLVLIDGLGAVTTPAEESAAQLRKGLRAARRPRSASPRYPDSSTAVAARVAGGVTPIDAETATPLVERNLMRESDGHVRLRTDGRLLWPSPLRLSPEQVLALLGAIQAPVLLIEGEKGILAERENAQAARAAVPHLTRNVLPGGHHLHLEPANVAAVARAIETWLEPRRTCSRER